MREGYKYQSQEQYFFYVQLIACLPTHPLTLTLITYPLSFIQLFVINHGCQMCCTGDNAFSALQLVYKQLEYWILDSK